MIKIICFDLDGTLLNSEKKVSDVNKAAIKKAADSGIEIVVCTGRQNRAARKFKELIGVGNYMICSNGSEIIEIDSGEELFSNSIDKEIVQILYKHFRENSSIVNFKFDTKYARYVLKSDILVDDTIDFDENDEKFFEQNNVLQIVVVFKDDESCDEFAEKIKGIYGVKVEYKFSLKDKGTGERLFYLDLVNSSVSKGNSVSGLARYLNSNLGNVVCFGDGINDLSMIQIAGYGIAMGNASEILKENADEVIGDNNSDAISKVIERIILENEQERNN